MKTAERCVDVKLYYRLSDLTLGCVTRRLAHRSFDPTAVPETVIDVPAVPETEGWLLEGLPAPWESSLSSFKNTWLVYCKARYNRHVADLSGGFNKYMGKFSAKTRSTLRRKLRKFAEASGGEIKWRSYREPDHMAEFYRLARELSRKTYQERLLKVGFPESDTFLANLIQRAELGAVRGYVLFLDDAPVSYLYLPIQGERAIYTFLGYDPKAAKLSSGTVLHLLAIKELCASEEVRYLDFTQGEGQQKEMFGTFSVPCVDLLLLRQSLRNQILITTHAYWGSLEKGIGNALDQVGVKKIIKSSLRRAFLTTRET